jgi:Na+-transporting NADH:ubiquinone oxidoreductase subunit A
MRYIKLKKGLNLPVEGKPEQIIKHEIIPNTSAILGNDYIGMKPSFEVKQGDNILAGQVLFTDKKMPKVKYVAPCAGTVKAINRGEKRRFLSIEISRTSDKSLPFQQYTDQEIIDLERDKVFDILLNSGYWPAIRTRPFSKVANPDTLPSVLLVTAIDTRPYAPSVDMVLHSNEKHFTNGINFISKIAHTYICKAPTTNIPFPESDNVSISEFEGPHPAGLVGTHIHFIDPVHREKNVWYIDYQDIIQIGKFLATGRICSERVVALAGTGVETPSLVKTENGACLDDITDEKLNKGVELRVISGSILHGRKSEYPTNYLARYHSQVAVIQEGGPRRFMHWIAPGFALRSVKNIYISKIFGKKTYSPDTLRNGSIRAIVPVGLYEKVMPLDISPTHLLKAILVKDADMAEKLGCLELDEEDLSLCTYVCPGKNDYGKALRELLSEIEKEM